MEAIVLIHGLWLPGWELWPLGQRLRAQGYATHSFGYSSVWRGLDENADRLSEFLERVPGRVVHALGHSLGGVLLLHALRRRPASRPGRLVCIGSPLTGSQAGLALAALPGGRTLLGRSLLEHLERGGLPGWSGERELGILAGVRPVGAGCLLTALPLPHDGTVSVAETELAGAADRICLPVSHASMLLSRAVAQQAVSFLRSGRFAHGESESAG